jgi:hypothetical protein
VRLLPALRPLPAAALPASAAAAVPAVPPVTALGPVACESSMGRSSSWMFDGMLASGPDARRPAGKREAQ